MSIHLDKYLFFHLSMSNVYQYSSFLSIYTSIFLSIYLFLMSINIVVVYPFIQVSFYLCMSIIYLWILSIHPSMSINLVVILYKYLLSSYVYMSINIIVVVYPSIQVYISFLSRNFFLSKK